MSNKKIYNIVFFILSVVFILLSCNKEESSGSEIDRPDKDTKLNIAVSTYSGNDPLEKDGDCSFSSLALYVFNKDDGYCEYARRIEGSEVDDVSEFYESILVTGETKIIYAIANYNDSEKIFTPSISENLSMTELENLTVSSNSFSGDNILMIGKKEVAIDETTGTVLVVMERVVSRLDLYFFKSSADANDHIEVVSVELVNRIKNSNCQYEDNSMLIPISKDNYKVNITTNQELSLMPATLDEVIPANAHASIYTYQNNITSPLLTDTAYLLVTIKENGANHTFKGYITDASQTTDKYSLKRNTVYRIIAMMNGVDNELILNTSVLPWSVVPSEIGYHPDKSNYSLDPLNNNTGAINGIVQYPYAIGGIGMNETSYAEYSFRFTAPAGAIWTATLTNGNDFSFFSEGSTSGKLAVSKGIARDEEYEIKVGAKRPWSGTESSTHLYITVNGEKLIINPENNHVRKFPGTNDTDILIKQTKYE